MRWTFDRRLALDTALAGLLAVAAAAGSAVAADVNRSAVPLGIAGYALVVVAALALTVRRRMPLATLAGSALCTSAYLAVGYPY